MWFVELMEFIATGGLLGFRASGSGYVWGFCGLFPGACTPTKFSQVRSSETHTSSYLGAPAGPWKLCSLARSAC